MPLKKKSQTKSFRQKYYLILTIVLVFVATYIFSNNLLNLKSNKAKDSEGFRSYNGNIVSNENNLKYRNGSRLWIEYAQELVKKNKPTPPESARFYAYVASVYSDTLSATGSNIQASRAVREIINFLMPEDKDTTDKYLADISDNSSEKITKATGQIVDQYKQRGETDGKNSLVWDGAIPTGVGKWTGKNPLVPKAGEWTRWIVDQNYDFQTPPPPTYNSVQDKKEIEIVSQAVTQRDDNVWLPKIKFWAGGPGTEAPLGIWLNRLYDETKEQKVDDMSYARWQKILTQSVADAFMECWKVKYTYWTARPSMRMKQLSTTQDNPNFPSYISGHSTISRTASVVLSALIPQKTDVWIHNSEEARDTRLVSGIHFKIDNDNGYVLGEKMGKFVLSKIDLAKS